jgi:hypothetical protein
MLWGIMGIVFYMGFSGVQWGLVGGVGGTGEVKCFGDSFTFGVPRQ